MRVPLTLALVALALAAPPLALAEPGERSCDLRAGVFTSCFQDFYDATTLHLALACAPDTTAAVAAANVNVRDGGAGALDEAVRFQNLACAGPADSDARTITWDVPAEGRVEFKAFALGPGAVLTIAWA